MEDTMERELMLNILEEENEELKRRLVKLKEAEETDEDIKKDSKNVRKLLLLNKADKRRGVSKRVLLKLGNNEEVVLEHGHRSTTSWDKGKEEEIKAKLRKAGR